MNVSLWCVCVCVCVEGGGGGGGEFTDQKKLLQSAVWCRPG